VPMPAPPLAVVLGVAELMRAVAVAATAANNGWRYVSETFFTAFLCFVGRAAHRGTPPRSGK
jgi:hypothetical protein